MSALKPKYEITDSIAAGLTEIERARGFLEAATLSDDWIRQMANRALVLEAHHTTHIEGTHLSLDQAEKLWAGEAVPEADPDDTKELLNYRDAFNFVSEYMEDKGPVSEGLIREIHKRLVHDVRGGTAMPGEYRKVQNYVVNSSTGKTIYTPPPPGDVPALMQEMTEWLGNPGDTHPVLVSGIAQFQLVHIHPFCDGNGRVSRLLSTLCLYREGYDFKRLFTISEYYDRDRSAFYKAIQGVRDSGMNLTGWLEFFIQGLKIQMHEVKEKGAHSIRRDVLVKKHKLNERQAELLYCLLKQKEQTIQAFEKALPEANRRTLQRDLKKLIDCGLATTKGHTHNISYVLKDSVL